jgi:hypothetical protein
LAIPAEANLTAEVLGLGDVKIIQKKWKLGFCNEPGFVKLISPLAVIGSAEVVPVGIGALSSSSAISSVTGFYAALC